MSCCSVSIFSRLTSVRSKVFYYEIAVQKCFMGGDLAEETRCAEAPGGERISTTRESIVGGSSDCTAEC